MTINDHALLHQEILQCRLCTEILESCAVAPLSHSESVIPRPILQELRPKPIMLLGQAPGLQEYRSGRPFYGDAGRKVRAIFADAGLGAEEFEDSVHTSAVVKCFPGRELIIRHSRQREQDRIPSSRMIRNCRPFFLQELKIVDPKLLVLLGSFPLRQCMLIKRADSDNTKLEHFVGRTEIWNKRKIIVLPHTSGSSRWMNKEENRELFLKAKELLRQEISCILAETGKSKPANINAQSSVKLSVVGTSQGGSPRGWRAFVNALRR